MITNRLHAEYKRLYRKITRYISNGKWYKFSSFKRQKFLIRLESMATRLKGAGYKVASAAGLGALLAAPTSTDAQAVPMSDVTFADCGFTAGVYTRYDKSSVALGDIDDDGDLDLVINEYYGYNYLRFFENQGDANTPNFVEQVGVNNPFSYLYAFYGYDNFSPDLADWDGDGDLDIAMGDNGGFVYMSENMGTPGAPDFSNGFTPAIGYVGFGEAIPAFADLDNDGDQDLFIGAKSYAGSYIYHFDNDGTGIFTYVNYGVSPVGSIAIPYSYAAPSFADLDCDSDLDLAVGKEYFYTSMFENIGDQSTAMFQENTGADNPFDAITTPYFNHDPEFGDLDGDGDMDMLLGDFYGSVQCFENTTIKVQAPIPTMGQWGILITGLFFSILGILGIKRKEEGGLTLGKLPVILLLACFSFQLNAQSVQSGKMLSLSLRADKTEAFTSAMDGQLQDLINSNNLNLVERVKVVNSDRNYLFLIEYNDVADTKALLKSLNTKSVKNSLGLKGVSPRYLEQHYGTNIGQNDNSLMVGMYRLNTDFDSWVTGITPAQLSGNGMKVVSISTYKRDKKKAIIHYEITDMEAARSMLESPNFRPSMIQLGMTPARVTGGMGKRI